MACITAVSGINLFNQIKFGFVAYIICWPYLFLIYS